MKHTVEENKANDHQRKNVLMYDQILLTSTIRNIWTTVRRTCTLILGLKAVENIHKEIGATEKGPNSHGLDLLYTVYSSHLPLDSC